VRALYRSLLRHVSVFPSIKRAELLAEVPRYRYLLAADDDLDDGSQPHPCWEEDSARRRLQDAYEEAVEGHQAALRSTAASEGDVR
jgi:ATP-binding cassette subfamily B protein